jgi:hypothetical protein
METRLVVNAALSCEFHVSRMQCYLSLSASIPLQQTRHPYTGDKRQMPITLNFSEGLSFLQTSCHIAMLRYQLPLWCIPVRSRTR